MLVTRNEIPNPNTPKIRTVLNGQTMQDWNTMIFDVPTLIEFLSGSTTLVPVPVILTGTPHCGGMAQKPPRWLKAEDGVTIEIEKWIVSKSGCQRTLIFISTVFQCAWRLEWLAKQFLAR